jgi:hypothetical protein
LSGRRADAPSANPLNNPRGPMSHPAVRRPLLFGLALASFSVAPAPPDMPPKPSPLAEARYKAASRQFEEVWAFYRQSRTDSFLTYDWSRLVLESQQDLSDARADRIAALEAHLERMRGLEALVLKVRKLGFGFSTDVGATAYYRIEAERWLEKARAG